MIEDNFMNKTELYHVVNRCGFTVKVFSDHSNFFSSWSLIIKADKREFMIEHNGRESWLIFYEQNKPKQFQEIDKKISHNLNDSAKLKQCELWLLSI